MYPIVLLWLSTAPPVAITEFHYDPADGRPGYVELMNTTSGPVNLRNWRLQRRQVSNETNRFIATADLLLPPGARLVLTADPAAMAAAFGEGPWHAMARYPTFNRTTADEIRLFDASGRRIDSLQYSPSVWIRGTAHERRTVDVAADIPENWAPGFSPGRMNRARPPDTPPALDIVGIRPPVDIQFRFDRRLNAASQTCGTCVIAEGRPMTVFAAGLDRLTIRLPDGNPVSIRLTGIRDVFGNTMADTLLTIQPHYPTPSRDRLVLNELQLWAPDPFIEILNVTDQAFDLAGMSVNGRAVPRTELGDGFHQPVPIGPGALGILTHLPAFTRSGGGIGLRAADGRLLDSLRYSSPLWRFGPDDRSLERVDARAPANDPLNWASHPAGNSRGSPNHHQGVADGFPEPDMADRHAGFIRIRFPRFVLPEADTRVDVDGSERPLLDTDPMTADTWFVDSTDGREAVIRHRGRWYGPFPIAQPAEPGGLLLNEILYQPHQDRYSGRADQPQYVEIHNPTPTAVSLETLHLTDAPDKHGQVVRIHPVSTDRRWLEAGGYAVIFADTAADWSSTRLHRAFPDVPAEATLRAHRSTLSLTQAGKVIRLARGDGVAIDSMAYGPSMHHPSRTEPAGVSLEKIDPRQSSAMSGNWTSSADPAGGTPGRANSVMRQPEDPRQRAGIRADPNPFRDRQAIHIRADEPDYWVRLRIYDRYGRLIRTLATADPLGNGRYWWWDGLRDDGRPPGMGLYVAVAELHGSRTAADRTLRQVLVLAR